MPFEISIDKELGAVVIRATRVVGQADVEAAVDDVVALPGFELGMNQLFDLTNGGLDMDGAEAKRLAQFFQSADVRAKLGTGYRLAVVATAASDFGTARMFQAREEEDSIAIRVFHSLEAARRWMRESESHAAPERNAATPKRPAAANTRSP